MSKSKAIIVALVLALSLFLALRFGTASPENPFREIMGKLELIIYLLEDTGPVPKTGQTVSHYEGDDGTWQMGMHWPEERFIDNGDGTITDSWTRLMWTEEVLLISEQMNLNWFQAVDACNDLDFAGYFDWRLPNVRELLSLIDYGQNLPAFPEGHPFKNIPSYPMIFWCSNTFEGNYGNAYHVGIGNGTVNHFDKGVNVRYVWAVRGGYPN